MSKAVDHVASYEFHGFEQEDLKNGQSIGNCLFCNKERHFYIDRFTGKFKCFRCGAEGNTYRFLELIYKLAASHTNDSQLLRFSRLKGIEIETLKEYGLVFNETRYLLPIYNENNTIVNLAAYSESKRKFINTTSMRASLLGYEQLFYKSRNHEPVYFCEGYTDTFKLNWLLKKTGQLGIVVGLPSASVWRSDWETVLGGRFCRVACDYDDSGAKGQSRLISRLCAANASRIEMLVWPPGTPPKYDIRDFIVNSLQTDSEEDCFKRLDNLFVIAANQAAEPKSEPTGPKPPIHEIIQAFKDCRLEFNKNMEDAVRVAMATAISQRLNHKTTPVWMYLVGPPGTGKTTILDSMAESPEVIYQSSFHAAALVSGANVNGNDPSILAKVDNKCLVLKDFTEVIKQPKPQRDTIFSIMRGAFDGEANRIYGNGVQRRIKCYFSFLAGVTKEIYNNSDASCGERALKFNVISLDTDYAKQAVLALDSVTSPPPKEAKEHLRELVNNLLSADYTLTDEKIKELVPVWFTKKLIALGQFVGHIRTPVMRHTFGQLSGELIYRPQAESANRPAIQLQKLAICLALIEDKPVIDREIYEIVKKVAIDTVEGFIFEIVHIFMREKVEYIERKDFSRMMRLGDSSTSRYLNDLMILNVLEKKQIHKDPYDPKWTTVYALVPEIKTMYEIAEIGI